MSLRALAVAMLAALTAPSGVLAFCQPKTEYCVPPIDCGERPQVPCFEKPPPDELQNIDRIVKLTIEQLQADHAARCRAGAQLRRDAHAKHHGCVRGSFEVMTGKIPVRHRVGVFKQQMTYPAWIRFSNSSSSLQSDKEGAGRGMAIKLMGIPGDKLLKGVFPGTCWSIYEERTRSRPLRTSSTAPTWSCASLPPEVRVLHALADHLADGQA